MTKTDLDGVLKSTFFLDRHQVLRINAESEEHIQLLKELEDDEGWEVRQSYTLVKLFSANFCSTVRFKL